ncbi:MAG: hypothetical protein APF84_16105 [Gracilibacter sp. BRH_c7a]|nr:MAG: hypothetical protein APF84_16105 [Gracilibacter sp. BRH_c7a]
MVLLVIGIILGILGTKLWDWKQAKQIRLSIWQYIAGAVWLIWVFFGCVFVVLSIGEGESRAASLGALIFGGVALLAVILVRQLYTRRKGRAPAVSDSASA